MAVNLKNPQGIEVMYRLCKDADVFVSNYRTKGLKRLGLDYETLHELNPRLIYATITGYGEEGPVKDAPGFDAIAFWARSGLHYSIRDAEGPLPLVRGGMGDLIAGQQLALGVCGALYHRTITGKGLKVSASLLSTGMFVGNNAIIESQYGEAFPVSRKRPAISLINHYECTDGWVALVTLNFDRDFFNILKVLGRGDLEGDPRWKTMSDTEHEGAVEVVRILDEAMGKLTCDEVVSRLASIDVGCQKIVHPLETFEDEQVRANNYLYQITNPDGKTFWGPSTPVRIGDNMPAESKKSPNVGEHSSEVMRELGYSDSEIKEYMNNGAVVETARWECTVK